jgi:HK97 family phage major capsid protein
MSEQAQVRELLNEIQKAATEARTWNEKNQKDRDSLIQTTVDKAAEAAAAKHEALTQRLDSIETKLNRSAAVEEAKSDESKATQEFIKARRDRFAGLNHRDGHHNVTVEQYGEYAKAMNTYMRYGNDDGQVTKSLFVGSDADGGNWIAPPTVSGNIVNRVLETSPIRDVANVVTISTASLKIPENPNEFAGGWVAETASRSQTATPVVAMKEIIAAELFAQPAVSQQMLEDSAINVESWVGQMAGDKLSRIENTGFVLGSGVNQPRGILSYPANSNGDGTNKWGEIQQVGSGTSGAFTYAGLINLIVSIKDAYQSRAAFLLRRTSVAKIMLLTDSNGRYIFQPILSGDFNNTPLLGYKMKYANDMPAPAAGSLSLAFGDFKAGYFIVDRVGISLLRDNLTAKPFVLFYFRKRTGGAVVDYDAIKLQILS